MVTNNNASKEPSVSAYVDMKKYVGVASVNILAVNPTNAQLRNYGWTVPEGADEQNYVYISEDENGKVQKSAKVRFLAQIQDLEDKPVIPLDIWVRPEYSISTSKKFKIIDSYGRTAWATEEEANGHKIPVYSSGAEADIDKNYTGCHPGQEELVVLLMKYLNVTPVKTYNKKLGAWEKTANPGQLVIDDWKAICSGDKKELNGYLNLQPDNKFKIILGLKHTDDNKAYQTFIVGGLRDYAYAGNAIPVNSTSGEYDFAVKGIEKFKEKHPNSTFTFSARPVQEYVELSSSVEDNSEMEVYTDNEDDLPF